MYRLFIKRFIDIIISFLGLVILSPVFIAIILFLFITNHGHPFFIQFRPGRNEKVFKLIKFRTMNNKRDANGKPLPDEKRLTKAGFFFRKTSLDEIPQLINVLKGEMSLIGPRPLLVEYLPLYNNEQKKRHLVRPGISGWAQVNGRNLLSWEKKFKLDVEYVENLTFWLDLKIVLLSFIKIIKLEGINANTKVTMKEFKGTQS